MDHREKYRRISRLVVLSAFFFLIPLGTSAEELALINRPVNTSGLTGLLFTTAPYTLESGTVEVGASVIYESSVVPDYTISEYPLNITVGMPHNTELAIRDSYFQLTEGPTGTSPTERTSGNLSLALKWNFLPSSETSIRPAVSLIIGGLFSTDSDRDKKINTVRHWGAFLGLSAGTEISWGDHVLGIYADGQVIGHDPTVPRQREIYEQYNAGFIIPVSKHQNLQMFLEYNIVNGRDIITIDGGDYTAFTYGIRLVSERFNMTMGSQFLKKSETGYDNSGRVIGLASMKF